MTKCEFMRELTSLLSKIPEDERNDALQYYEDYFADAGITDQMLVPNSVGTPQQVADKIIGEAIYGNSPEQMTDELKDVPARKKENKSSYNSDGQTQNNNNGQASRNSNSNNTNLILAILLILLTSPFWIGVVTGIGGILFGILAALGGMILGFGIAGIALIITSFLASSLAATILLMGTGMLLTALAIVLIIPLVLYCGRFLPWLIRETVNLIRKLFGKKEYVS